MEETDDHNKKVVKDLEDKIKKLTTTTKQGNTWRAKLKLQNRRLKRAMKNKDKIIADMTEHDLNQQALHDTLQTENSQLTTVIMDLQTENMVLHEANDQKDEDFDTVMDRLADNSCAYCGTSTPATSSTDRDTPTPATSSSDPHAKWFTPW